MNAELNPQRDAARTLGAALRRLGYVEDAVTNLLGEDAYGAEAEGAVVLERRLPEGRLATVVRAFFLELPVPRAAAVQALGEAGVSALVELGLAEVSDSLAPLARIVPVRDVLVASDPLAKAATQHPDYVATYTPTTHLCDALTPRPRVERALDVGTGNGIHALLATRHVRHVVATDVNERALAFTEINAALNDVRNLECRRGSLFEPVAGETFDLIVCNAPFVVSPENRLTYRDGGLRGDEFSERVVLGAAEHLADGGYATLTASWLASDPDAPDEHALAWVEETGCDAWILADVDATPLEHAADWNDGDASGATLDRWTAYFDELGVTSITEGAILLNRRDGAEPFVRADTVDSDEIEAGGDQVLRAFEARARLAEIERSELLDERLTVEMPLRVEGDLEPRRGAPAIVNPAIRILAGTHQVVDAPHGLLEVFAALDGRTTLREALETRGATALRRGAIDACAELLELGALQFA